MRGGRRFARTGRSILLPVAFGFLLAVPMGLATGASRSPAAPAPLSASVPHVYYTSSVDGWNLSYDEWLPTNYNASHSYPLIVYLHGQQDISGAWYRGGLNADIVNWLNATGSVGITARALLNATKSMGFILIAINTRSGSGWYVNSPCGGPQQQDVVDAILHERALRHISKMYLFGFSMGSEGTLSFAAKYRVFSGIGVLGPVTDLFEDIAYRQSLGGSVTWANNSINAKAFLFCGVLPGTGNASQRALIPVYENMSPLRFRPQAFAGVPIYVGAGGTDDRAPDNTAIWAYWMNANNTFVNKTCNHAASLGEPAKCSTPMGVVHLTNPSYTFRFLYESKHGHDFALLDPLDMLGFWTGANPGGYYLGNYPFTTLTNNTSLRY